MANRRYIDFPIASISGDTDIILIWQDGANKQTTKATFLSGLPENLDELNDVAISGLTNGQILRYDSVTGKWENTDQGNLDLNDLNDVSIVSPSNGQVLVYNSSTSKWENSSGGFVPYVGAVTTVDLGAQGLRAGYVRFDTSVVTVPDEQGLMYWDASRSTAALIMNGTLQHIGQDSFFYVKNSSGSTIPKGTCVGFAGTDGGSGHLLVTPFLANGSVPSTYFMGVTAEAIANGSFGQVMHFGELEGINTSGFTAGALLYASSTVAGAFQTTAPVAPNNIILVAAAVNSKNNGAIVVRPTYGSNINTDEGVKITSPTTGDLLQLQAGGLWENKTLAQVIGSAYVPSTRTITINGTTQDLSADRTFNVGDMLLGDIQTVTARKDFNSNTLQLVVNGTSQKTILTNSPIDTGSYSLAINAFGFNASNNLYFSKGGNNNGIFAFSNSATRTYTLKDASGTLAFTSDIPSLSGYVQGTGTTNYLPKFTGASTIGNSQIFDNGTNVGIGTATPNNLLTIIGNDPSQVSIEASSGNTNSQINLKPSGTGIAYIKNQANTGFAFGTNNTEAMRLSASLNLLVGTSSDNGARLQVSGTLTASSTTLTASANSYAGGSLRLNSFTGGTSVYLTSNSGFFALSNGGGADHFLISSTGAATFSSSVTSFSSSPLLASVTSNPANDAVVAARWTSGTGMEMRYFPDFAQGYIQNTYQATSGQPYGDIYFRQNVGGTMTTRMTIKADGGNVLIGTTTDGGQKLRVLGTTRMYKLVTGEAGLGADNYTEFSNDDNVGYINTNRVVNNGDFHFRFDGTSRSNINRTTGVYTATSDMRLKSKIKNSQSAMPLINQIKVRQYQWNETLLFENFGFIAQELEEILPNYVHKPINDNDFWKISKSELVPLLVKAIQELKQEIDTLKN